MKLGKKTWLLLGIVIFAIAAVFLYLRYFGQIREQDKLRSTLSKAQSTLAKSVNEKSALDSQLADLESQLAKATSLHDATKASLHESIQSIEWHEAFLSLAGDSNLMITCLTVSEPRSQKEGTREEAITYLVTSFVVELEGQVPESIFTTSQGHKEYIYQTVSDILAFVTKVTLGEDFTVATVKLASLTVPEPLTEVDLDNWRRETRESLTEGEAMEEEEAIEERLTAEIKAVLEGMSEVTLEGKSWKPTLKVEKASATIEVSFYSLPR